MTELNNYIIHLDKQKLPFHHKHERPFQRGNGKPLLLELGILSRQLEPLQN